MCEITSMGEMSAARMTMPRGRSEEELDSDSEFAGAEVGDLRSALTTSLTPRLRVRWDAAIHFISTRVWHRQKKGGCDTHPS